MPAKIPFLDPSESLQQRWRESTSSSRVSAQIYVFFLLVSIGLLRKYVFPSSTSKTDHTYGSITASSAPGAKDETLGEVAEIFVYPIKSCAGVSVGDARLTGRVRSGSTVDGDQDGAEGWKVAEDQLKRGA